MFKHGSLFSGIGGFDLAAEWMGWNNVFHCEWNEFGQKILKHYWPNAISYGDITQTDFTIHRGTIDILTGGFPCQPYSVAGKRLGKEDERHLWPEMLRAIREIAPSYIVGENVPGLLTWNDGLVFDEVQADLENEGYEVQPVILPACGQNAPHKRERVWFVAYRTNTRPEILRSERENTILTNGIITNPDHNGQYGSENGQSDNKGNDSNATGANTIKQPSGCYSEGIITDTGCSEWKDRVHGKEQERETREFGDSYTKFGCFTKFPTTKPTICTGNDGFSTELDGITFPKWRNESIKAAGNAIVPQVALQIFKAIQMAAIADNVGRPKK